MYAFAYSLANNRRIFSGCLFALSIRLSSSASIFPITVNRHMRFRQPKIHTFSHSISFAHFRCVFFLQCAKLYWCRTTLLSIKCTRNGTFIYFYYVKPSHVNFWPYRKQWFYFGRKESALRIAIAIHHSYCCIMAVCENKPLGFAAVVVVVAIERKMLLVFRLCSYWRREILILTERVKNNRVCIQA